MVILIHWSYASLPAHPITALKPSHQRSGECLTDGAEWTDGDQIEIVMLRMPYKIC